MGDGISRYMWGPVWSKPGDFPTSLVLGWVGRGQGKILGKHAGLVCWWTRLRKFWSGLILGVWRGKVSGSTQARSFETVVGGQSFRTAQHSTGRLGLGRLA